MSVKLAILFYSTYGTNHQMAEIAADAARAAGAEVKLLRIAETAPEAVVNGQDAWKAQVEKVADIPVATPEDMEWADAYIFSAPTRFGAVPSQLRAFIELQRGLIELERGNWPSAESWFRKAAAQGHAQAADNYGLALFQSGKKAEALPWLLQHLKTTTKEPN